MKQVVRRRYKRVLFEDGGPFPDLVVIDGGKGQLNAAYEALEDVGLANLIAIGLAKKEELVFARDSDLPIGIDPHSPALRLLQRIRDEAHRFAVTFHRQQRSKRDLRSELTRSGHRPAPSQGAADEVRQPHRRPPRDARRAQPRGGRASRRRDRAVFRDSLKSGFS